jgi:uncharacterized phiE125 gp8 family phage protein
MSKWDTGITWHTTEVSRDDMTPVSLEFVRDKVLRAYTENVEDDLIDHYIRAAAAFGERICGQHILPKTLTLVLSAFPADGIIEFADAPIRDVLSVEYLDEDGVVQTYGGSPPSWTFLPAGRYHKARLLPGIDETWPTTIDRPNAVTVTFTVGYEAAEDVPVELQQAIAVTVGEFYKSPDLSNNDSQQANVLRLEHFWPRRWANGV